MTPTSLIAWLRTAGPICTLESLELKVLSADEWTKSGGLKPPLAIGICNVIHVFFPWFVEFSCHFIDLNMQKIVHQQCTIIACHTARSMPRGLVPRFACLVAAVVADALDLPSYETW